MTMPPWALLDFPIVVPAQALDQRCGLHAYGWGRDSPHPLGAFTEVSVAVGDDPEEDPDWVVTTRPRRGIRPLDPADGDGFDHLTVDADLPEMAAQAVAALLLATMRQDLPGDQLVTLMELDDEQSRAVGTQVRLRPEPGEPWRREVVRVDGAAYALWVHRQHRGWAAVADLGPVAVLFHGRAEPASWELSTASAHEAEALFAEREEIGENDRAAGEHRGWFGWRSD